MFVITAFPGVITFGGFLPVLTFLTGNRFRDPP